MDDKMNKFQFATKRYRDKINSEENQIQLIKEMFKKNGAKRTKNIQIKKGLKKI